MNYTIDVGPSGVIDYQASGTRTPSDWFFDALAGPRNVSGIRINPRSALSHGPVWTAINVLAGDMARLPTQVMLRRITREENRRKHEDEWRDDHPIDWLLNHRPNDHMTAYQWRETMMAWALAWGNGVSRIEYDRGIPVALHPLDPALTWAERIGERDWAIVTHDIDGRQQALLPDETFHIRGLASLDGFWGESCVQVCKRRLGAGIAADTHGAATWGNGALPGGLIKLEARMEAEAREGFRRDWNRMHQGSASAGRVGFLEPHMTWVDRSMSNRDAEWLDTVKLDREFVADMFLLPHYKVGALEQSSVRANLEAQSKEYVDFSLKRWGKRFESEGERKLLRRQEIAPTTRRFFLKTNYDEVIQGTQKEQAETHSLLVRSEIENPNEARKALGMNPRPGGDEYGNPAINPNQTQELQQPRETEETETPVPPDVEALIRSQVRACLIKESRRVAENGKRSKDFRGWAAKFYGAYGQHAEPFLAAASRVAGVDWRHAAVEHADVVLTRIQLGQPGTDWIEERADAFTESILNGRAGHG